MTAGRFIRERPFLVLACVTLVVGAVWHLSGLDYDQGAREESARLHHEYMGTEHILLGLIREGEGVAAAVRQNLQVDLDEIREEIEKHVKKGNARRMTGPDL